MFNNFIFDLYGTLVDIHTNENKASLWKYMSRYMSLQGAPYSPAELKKKYRALIRAAFTARFEKCRTQFPQIGPEEIEIDLSRVIAELYRERNISPTSDMIADWALMFRTVSLEYERLFDGAGTLLKALRQQGKKVFLLSNAQRLFTVPELRSLGIYDLFDDVFISSDLGFMKPSKQFYRALLQKHSLAPEACVMVGNDWKSDAWGAHNSGLASMYIHTAQSPELTGELPPDCTRLNTILDVLM